MSTGKRAGTHKGICYDGDRFLWGEINDITCTDSDTLRSVALRWRGIATELAAGSPHEQQYVPLVERLCALLLEAREQLDKVSDGYDV